MYWNHEQNTGIGKLHHPGLGAVIGFLFEGSFPIEAINFCSQEVLSYYRKKYKQQGCLLIPGRVINQDVQLVMSSIEGNIMRIPEIRLELKAEGGRYFRSLKGGDGWKLITAPITKFETCESLVMR